MMGTFRLGRLGKLLVRAGDPDYLVREGTVHVSLVPSRRGTQLRQMYLGCAGPGELVCCPPASAPNDATLELALLVRSAGDQATIEGRARGHADAPDARPFEPAEETGLTGRPETWEDFWAQVTAGYAERDRDRGARVAARLASRQETRESVVNIARQSYRSVFDRPDHRVARRDGGVYDACAFLCGVRDIPIAPYEELRRDFGDGELGVDTISRRSGFSVREATLKGRWAKGLEGGFLGYVGEGDDREVVVAYRRGPKVRLFEPTTGETRPLTRKDEARIDSQVVVFDRPFGPGPVTFREVAAHALHEVSAQDVALLLVATLLLSLAGVALSGLMQYIYDELIPRQRESATYVVGTLFVAMLVANFLFAIARNLTDLRITQKANAAVQIAIFHRVFHLPEQFFKGRESAEQAYRVTQLTTTYTQVLRNAMGIALSVVFAVVYLRRMLSCSPALTGLGIALAALGTLLVFLSGALSRRLSRRRMRATSNVRSFLYQAFCGIGTVRMAGAEDAVLEQYMRREGSLQELEGRLDRIGRLSTLAVTALNALGTLLMYWLVGSGRVGGVTLGVFMGFVSANAMFSTQVLAAARDLSAVVAMAPILKDTGELLMTRPEGGTSGQVLTELTGDIRLRQVSFGYPGSDRMVIKDVSLHVRPGEYVGIVGESGSGKSTLLRLLMGFETPARGQVLYDGVELAKLDIVELRRNIGSVLQDGSLTSGTILQNVRIVHPDAGREAVEAAIETAGLTREIEAMPMGLMTHVSEDALTISGGQKQRILIARAILGNPRVLLFDEATSSLDNIAQEQISEALARQEATRIVVAHRLSTVRLCDRIIVLGDGRIQEEGSYDELMEKRGTFYEMVKVQQAV